MRTLLLFLKAIPIVVLRKWKVVPIFFCICYVVLIRTGVDPAKCCDFVVHSFTWMNTKLTKADPWTKENICHLASLNLLRVIIGTAPNYMLHFIWCLSSLDLHIFMVPFLKYQQMDGDGRVLKLNSWRYCTNINFKFENNIFGFGYNGSKFKVWRYVMLNVGRRDGYPGLGSSLLTMILFLHLSTVLYNYYVIWKYILYILYYVSVEISVNMCYRSELNVLRCLIYCSISHFHVVQLSNCFQRWAKYEWLWQYLSFERSQMINMT